MQKPVLSDRSMHFFTTLDKHLATTTSNTDGFSIGF